MMCLFIGAKSMRTQVGTSLPSLPSLGRRLFTLRDLSGIQQVEKGKMTLQKTNQSTNQSNKQSINQSINQTIKQKINQSVNQPNNQPTNPPTNQAI